MYYSLQAARAIAAMLVVLFHLGEIISLEKYFGIQGFSIPFSFGNSGVEFFFVLSGFIIFHAHKSDLGKPKTIKRYIYRRVTRIYPVYIIIFLGVYGLAIASPTLRNTVPHDINLILKSLILIPLEKEVFGGTGAPVLVVAWTLQYEMMFYFAFGLGILNRLAGIILIYLYFVGLIFSFKVLGFPFSFLFSDYVILFIMGMLICQLTTYSSFLKPYSIAFSIIGLTLYALPAGASISKSDLFESYDTILYGFGCSFIVLALVLFEKQSVIFLKQKYIQRIGAASYVLYLIHFPLISILCKLAIFLGLGDLGFIGAFISYLVILCICLLAATAIHLVVEKPIARWLRQLVEKPKRGAIGS